MNLIMNEIERRVLGVMIEKQLTTGDYPMTLNALTAGCNQKSNRDPVMELDEDAVWNTLERLRERGLTAKVLPGMGSRVERYKHEIDTKVQWPKAQKSIMCELLLRGPQTVGELRTRASRMYAFENLEAVSAALDWLTQQSPPLAAPMPRVPGQSAIRYAHLLYPPSEQPAISADAAPRASGVPGMAGAVSSDTGPIATSGVARQRDALEGADISAIREQFEALQAEMAELHEQVSGLRRRVESLEGR